MGKKVRLSTGVVRFFHPQKRYGFLRSDEGEIFFHLRDGRSMTQRKEGAPEFKRAREKRIPKSGDSLIFMRKLKHRGYQATPWAFSK
jgi:hypothetical protein